MFYLIKNETNTVVTENWLDLIPVNFDVYLDDVLLGTFSNTSIKKQYLSFVIADNLLTNYTTMEYALKIINTDNKSLIKIEMVKIIDLVKRTENILTQNRIEKYL